MSKLISFIATMLFMVICVIVGLIGYDLMKNRGVLSKGQKAIDRQRELIAQKAAELQKLYGSPPPKVDISDLEAKTLDELADLQGLIKQEMAVKKAAKEA